MAKRKTATEKRNEALWDEFTQNSPTEKELLDIVENSTEFRTKAAQSIISGNPSMLALAIILSTVIEFATTAVKRLLNYALEDEEEKHLSEHRQWRKHGHSTYLSAVCQALIEALPQVPAKERAAFLIWLTDILSRWDEKWLIFSRSETSCLWRQQFALAKDAEERGKLLYYMINVTKNELPLLAIIEPLVKNNPDLVSDDHLAWAAEHMPSVRKHAVDRLLIGEYLYCDTVKVIVVYGNDSQREIALKDLNRRFYDYEKPRYAGDPGRKDFLVYVLSRIPSLEAQLGFVFEKQDLSSIIDQLLPLVSEERRKMLLQKYKEKERKALMERMKGVNK